jgi:hypothetical protein
VYENKGSSDKMTEVETGFVSENARSTQKTPASMWDVNADDAFHRVKRQKLQAPFAGFAAAEPQPGQGAPRMGVTWSCSAIDKAAWRV